MGQEKKRMGRKSQVTLIMGIATVLIVIFAVFYFTSRTSVKRQLGLEVSKELTKDIQPINEYITQCLGQVAKEGLVLLGEQGGQIFQEQGGAVDDSKKGPRYSVEYNGKYVNKAVYILSGVESGPSVSAATGQYRASPNYPWIKFPYENSISPTTLNGQFDDSDISI